MIPPEEKKYTDANEIINWHYNHCSGRNIKGVNFMSAVYHTEEICLPVAVEFVKKDKKVMENGAVSSVVEKSCCVCQVPTKTVQTQISHFIASVLAFIKLEAMRIRTQWNHWALKMKIMLRAQQAAYQEMQKLLTTEIPRGVVFA